jgi:hypothetical protein
MRAQREAALVVGVDQLVRHRRRVGQQAQPAEGVDLLEGRDRAAGTLARHTPWKPSQPAMKSQSSSCADAVLAVGDARAVAVEAVQRDVCGLVDGGRPRRRGASIRSRVTSVWP